MTKRGDSVKLQSRSSLPLHRRCSEISEGDEFEAPAIKEIAVTIESIENVSPNKVKEISIKMEFAGNLLAQSEIISLESCANDINLSGVIFSEYLDSQLISDILANPVLITVTDCTVRSSESIFTQPVKPEKEIKPKTSKSTKTTASPMPVPKVPPSNVLGICNLDIGSLVTGKTRIKESLILESDRKLIGPNIISWVKLPRLIVVATTGDEPLIPRTENKNNNTVGITVESVYNLPPNITEGTIFSASIPVPSIEDKNSTITFPNGVATKLPDLDCRKKWSTLLHVEGRGGRTKQEVSPNTSDIISPFQCKVDLEKEMNKQELRIQWNTWKNCLLTKSESNYFFSKLMKYRVWPIEITTAGKPVAVKTAKSDKKSKPATSVAPSSPSHFTAFLNLSSLLYPGVTKARVAAQLYTYSQSDLINKFGAEFQTSVPQPSMTAVKSKAASERSKASAKEPIEEVKDSPGVPIFNDDGLPVFIVVEVELWKPFTAKRSPERLDEELKSYLCLKGTINKKVMTFEKAKDNFKSSIKSIVSLLYKEYQNFIEENENNQIESEDFNTSFHNYIYRTESFDKVKNTLESKVIDLIAEKFGNLDQYNELIPEIYIYLVEEMHKITNCMVVGREDMTSAEHNTNELYLYAEEAMEEEEFELAKNYLLLRLSRQKSNPDYWLDHAVFCVKINEIETAVEAVREALSLDISHQMALLMYGLIMEKMKQENIAELAFQVLLSKHPDFIEGWLVLHLFYSKFNNFEGADVTFQMAAQLEYNNKKNNESGGGDKTCNEFVDEFSCKNYLFRETYKVMGEGKYGMASYVKGQSSTDPISWTTLLCPPNSVNIRTAVLLLKLGFHEYASMALAKEILTETDKVSPHYLYYLSVSHYLEGRYGEAICHLETAIKDFGKDCSLWGLMGHCYYKLDDGINAIPCYEYVIESYNRPDDIHLIYLRMGYYYLEAKKFTCAKQVFATGCKYSPTPKLWMGTGIACLNLEEYDEAETAFSEANYLDNKNPDSWGYLALTNAYMNRLELFKYCYLEAKKRNLSNQTLIHKIQSCMELYDIEGEE